jgi:hypothetical protein
MSLKEQLAHANELGRLQVEQARKTIAEFEEWMDRLNEACLKRCDELQQFDPAQGKLLPAHLEIKLGELQVKFQGWDLIETKTPLPPLLQPRVGSEIKRIVRKPPAPRPIVDAPPICLMCGVLMARESLLVLHCAHRVCQECLGHHLAKLVNSCQDLVCPHLHCSQPIDDCVLERCLSERELSSVKRLRHDGQVPYKTAANLDKEERKADGPYHTEQAPLSVPTPQSILDLEPHKPDTTNLIDDVVPPTLPVPQLARSLAGLEESKVRPQLPDSNSAVTTNPASSGLIAPASHESAPDSPAKSVIDLEGSSSLDNDAYSECSVESGCLNNIDVQDFTCSCVAPHLETLLCKHEVCNCCFKLYVIQQLSTDHFDITSFTCPTCRSRISEGKLYWIFGGQVFFESLFMDALVNAEFICDVIRDSGRELINKACPGCLEPKVNTLQTDFVTCPCGSSFCWVCGVITDLSDQDQHSCEEEE